MLEIVTVSLNVLKDEQAAAWAARQRRQQLGSYAESVLRKKGFNVFSQDTTTGGSGGFGGQRPATLYTQATGAVQVGNSYLALRNCPQAVKAKQPGVIELVEVKDDSRETIKAASGGNIIVTFAGAEVELVGVGEAAESHLASIENLVTTIDGSFEEVPVLLGRMPKVLPVLAGHLRTPDPQPFLDIRHDELPHGLIGK